MAEERISQLDPASALELTDDTVIIINTPLGTTKRTTFGDLKGTEAMVDIQCARVEISAAQLLNINTTPALLVEAPPVGYGNIAIDVVMRATFGGTAFVGTTQAEIIGATFSGNYLGFAGDVAGQRWTLLDDTDTLAIWTGSWELSNATGNPTLGDSGITIYIFYRRVLL